MTDKLPPLLDVDRIKFTKKIKSKKCAFDALTELLTKGQSEVSKHEVFDALIEREKLGNTAIGDGIAIPRAHLNITNPKAALLIVKNGIDLNSADKKSIVVFLAILTPNDKRDVYSALIKRITKKITTKERYSRKVLDDKINSKNPELIAKFFESLFSDAD